MKRLFSTFIILVGLLSACNQDTLNQQVEDVLAQLTIEEKISIIHAQSKFSSSGIARLGIPDLWTTDGPHGIRPEVLWDEWDAAGWTNDSCIAYPALTCLAASWDVELASIYGKCLGEEAKYRKKNVLLAPGVNICRHPLNGRNFEYMGEDPYLAATMAVPYIKAVQKQGVAACVKHYALNDQEFERHTINVNVDDRALYEIYLFPFEKAVKDADVWSIMAAFNKYGNQYCCHNRRLLVDILKKEWNFKGAVISDWGGTYNLDEAIHNGLDLEFGTFTDGLTSDASNSYDNYFLANPYLEKIKNGEVGTDELDDKCRRVLRLLLRTSEEGYGHGKFLSPDHYSAARKIGAEGIVLLKNDDSLLPVRPNAGKILVLGENAIKPMTVGGGSSSLKVQREISVLQGIREAFPNSEVVYERAYQGSPKGGYDAYGEYDITDKRTSQQMLNDAVAACTDADYVIFVGGLNKDTYQDSESADRLSYELPYGQNEVIEALADVRSDMIVVNISGNPVAMPWADRIKAIIQCWYLGSEAGHSLADVISGQVSPSGKLPFSYPFAMEDGPVKTQRQYPGLKDNNGSWQIYYDEGIYVGYRWYDTEEVPVRFPFGFGLSYTTFEYGDLEFRGASKERLKFRIKVRNSGDVAGAEVVQLYVAAPGTEIDRPRKELKAFDKVYLSPGEEKFAEFVVEKADLRYFDASDNSWKMEKGSYHIMACASSIDIKSEVKLDL